MNEQISMLGLQSVLSMLVLEFIKQLAYRINPKFSIDPRMYIVALPVLALAVVPVASWLTGGAFDMSFWTQDALRQTALLVVTTVASMFGYNASIKPLKIAMDNFSNNG